ncbi:ELKS/Rab6-interacting/CAST family member 1 [Collichthys lucidus]|uniref:ELKS/Rab6-interacting/CAST family member 1 n=1 Tax=Collichthys lucidus TaxID=240159 RepID=A0A4U5URF7_COLLU|nr:ELKS/Rab6-interacting/CAST family member 1 [Collichthys lucidus]
MQLKIASLTQNAEEAARKCPDITDPLRLLEQEVARNREESGKSQAEVERLMAALREAEMDRSFKEKKIADLESFPHSDLGAAQCDRSFLLLTTQQLYWSHAVTLRFLLKGTSAVILWGASQDAMRETAERIGELEMALRESMNTSAHREALWAQEESARVQAQRQISTLSTVQATGSEMSPSTQGSRGCDSNWIPVTHHDLPYSAMRGCLNQLLCRCSFKGSECGGLPFHRMSAVVQLWSTARPYIWNTEKIHQGQQALLAAISEKDANIALLELSSSHRKKAQEEVMALKREKDRLMHQLKQQTQSRMKMIADNYEEDHIHPQHHPHHSHHLHSANVHHRSLPRGPPHPNHRPPMDQSAAGCVFDVSVFDGLKQNQQWAALCFCQSNKTQSGDGCPQ